MATPSAHRPAAQAGPPEATPCASLTLPAAALKRDCNAHGHTPNGTRAGTSCPTHHTSVIQTRHTSADLYTHRPILPPAISSFRHCAAISYDDFLEASGSSSRIIDLSKMPFVDVVQNTQAAFAQRLGCSQADICWVVQTHYEVAPGVPLSYTSSLSTPECVASLVLLSVFAQLETAVMTASSEPDAPARFTTLSRTVTPHAFTSADSAGTSEASCKRACIEPPHAHPISAASAGTADMLCMHEDHASGRLGGRDGNAIRGPAEPLFVRCGLDGVAGGRTAVRAVMQQVVRSIAQHAAADGATVAKLIRCCGDIAADVVKQFDATSEPAAASGTVEDGEGVSGSAAAHVARYVATGDGSFPTQHECELAGESPDEPQLLPPDRDRGDKAGGVDVGEFQRRCRVSGQDDRAAGNGAAKRPAGDKHRAAEPSEDAGEAGGSADGGGEAEVAQADAYHKAVTRTLCAVLRASRDVCYEVSAEWRAGAAQAAEVPLPAAEAEERRQEQVHRALTEVCIGLVMPKRDAGRVMCSLAVNQISVLTKQFEVENAHVHYYRHLALSAEQRAEMAAWWHSWLGHKRALNATAAAARRALESLPNSLPLPRSHLSHICRVAEGAAPPRPCAACARRAASPGPYEGGNCTHVCHACGATDRSGCGAVVVHGGRVQGVGGCGGCGGPVDEVGGVPLGADAASMCRAAEALRLLLSMQDVDGALSVSAVAMHLQPGALLDAGQLAWICRKTLLHGCPMIDHLVLCQLAATQLRRQEMCRWPAVLGAPLPDRM